MESPVQSGATILSLDEDSLNNIFRRVSEKDLLSLALTCVDFFNCVQSRFITNLKRLDIDEPEDWYAVEERLSLYAPLVEEVHIRYYTNDHLNVMEHIMDKCVNVKVVNVWINAVIPMPLLSKLSHVTFRSIFPYNWKPVEAGPTDEIMACLESCENLKSISLDYCVGLTGKNLHLLRHIKCLEINSGRELDKQFLTDICVSLEIEKLVITTFHIQVLELIRVCKHLKYLEIRHNDIMFEAYDSIAENNAEHLESLILSDNVMSPQKAEFVGRLLKLKCLQLSNCNAAEITQLHTLVELQELTIRDSEVTNDTLFELLEHCPKIKFLALYGCPQINNAFVIQIANLLKERPGPSEHITLRLMTAINKSILEDPTYLSVKNFLKIHLCGTYVPQE